MIFGTIAITSVDINKDITLERKEKEKFFNKDLLKKLIINIS
jgi:hypothetical protein